MGDFNIDTIKNDSKLEKFLLDEFNFTKSLANESSTTNFNTQIDTIFTKNINKYHSGIYDTYFSDHKPIFIGISNEMAENTDKNEISSSRFNKKIKYNL